MKTRSSALIAKLVVVGLAMPVGSVYGAFDSGSTGADGAFAPSSNVTLTVPPNGKFNFTTVNIPFGVTVTFTANAQNTPVYFLANGNMVISGIIDLSGQNGGAGSDSSIMGRRGPGGGDGGRGGIAPSVPGGDGLGPGGGRGGIDDGVKALGGGGGGYVVAGSNAPGYTSGAPGSGGAAYGSGWLQPLVGGSGGGGGAGSASAVGAPGGGGGGGGGAILIASSGTISGNGTIRAAGGRGDIANGSVGTPRCGSSGGGGSGGAVHLIASTFANVASINVFGGQGGGNACTNSGGGDGADGYKRSEVLFGGTLDVSAGPTLAITSVGGTPAPATLTGYGDITISATEPNPVTVELKATGVPTGGTVTVTVSPAMGASTTVTSTPLSGTLATSTATAQINVPNGLSSVQASTNYTVPLALVEPLTKFAGEPVKSLTLTSVMNGGSKTVAITESGKELELPAAMLAQVALVAN